ncbi:hypothetical protein K7B10_19585 [Streptomyces flavotricini]|uniref:Uncharacterized protein n=1 Tax=Streptomyces flavotricini TaxID=66888 RepID=A0ABS8E8C7_9ACTN|nr:hypothetical protein [Streptomyces flavotricini]MCC0096954.1 hypothetical protein [Streptomyces flavotricini]
MRNRRRAVSAAPETAGLGLVPATAQAAPAGGNPDLGITLDTYATTAHGIVQTSGGKGDVIDFWNQGWEGVDVVVDCLGFYENDRHDGKRKGAVRRVAHRPFRVGPRGTS